MMKLKARLMLACMLAVGCFVLAGCGPPDINSLESNRDVDGLIKALDHKDPAVVVAAAEALGRIGDSSAVEPLSIKVRSTDSLSEQQAAIAALGQIGGTHAMLQLLIELSNNKRSVREAASDALAHIGEPAVDRLINVLSINEKNRREAALAALVQIGEPAVEPLVDVLKKAGNDNSETERVEQALVEIGDAAIEPLVAILQDENIKVRERAVRMLDELGWRPDMDEVGAIYYITLRDWNNCIRIGAPAVEPLIEALADEDDEVRENAANALGVIGDDRAVEPLITALNDEWGGVQMEAAQALGRIGDPRAVEPLSSAILDEDGGWNPPAVYALGELGDIRAVDSLLATLRHEDNTVRNTALAALGKIGNSLLLDLTPTLSEIGAICSGDETAPAVVTPELFYPLVVFEEDGKVNDWTPVFLLRWEPDASRETQLVACVHETKSVIEKCEYGAFGLAGSITRYQQKIEIVLRQAETGDVIGQMEFINSPEECPEERVMGAPSTGYYGEPLFTEWDAWLADYLP